ncbi:MAG: hypothetical protein PHI88_03355, partial [Candidatus Pacebacteria bacterium]|nr:hypothetical protein [Candidatus Paceibacterota bacterium]
EEGTLYKQLTSMEKQLESQRYKEDQWQANKARAYASKERQEQELEKKRIQEESAKAKQQWGGGPSTGQK